MRLSSIFEEHLVDELQTGFAVTSVEVQIKTIEKKKTIKTKTGGQLDVCNIVVTDDGHNEYRLGLFGSKADYPSKLDLNEGEKIHIVRAFFKQKEINGKLFNELSISDYHDKTFGKDYIEKVKS